MAFTKTAINFIWKMISYKQGANALFSFLASSGATTSMWMAGNLEWFNKVFIKDVDPKAIFFPFLVEILMIILFVPMTGFDFILGFRVARKIRNEKFDKDRFYDTIIKTLAIIIVTSLLMFLAFGTASAGYTWLWPVLMFFLCFLWVLCIGYEFASIGDNFKALNGQKSEIFVFFDKLMIVLQNKFINKVENSFPQNNDENEKQDNTDK